MKDGIKNYGNLKRIQKVMKKAENGEPITVGFLGGSITMGSVSSTPKNCYAYLTYEWWKSKFPKSKVTYVNAGIGGTTSHFGVSRADSDILYAKPDFVIVEFSVNDRANEHFEETYEGLLRKILKSESKPAVLIVNSVQYNDGENAQEFHNRLGKYYNLPIISMKDSIYKEVEEGRILVSDITPDNLHPNDKGHKLMSGLIIDFLEKIYQKVNSNEVFEEYVFPQKPITSNGYEDAIRLQNYNTNPEIKGFIKDERKQDNICDIFKNGWYSKNLKDKITFKVTAGNIALQYRKTINKPAPIAQVTIDNNKKILLDGNFDETWGDCLFLEDILIDKEVKEHIIDIEIIQVPKEVKTDFYLVSLIISNLTCCSK